MACAEVAAISPLNVPGLDKAHTVTDLAVARNTYDQPFYPYLVLLAFANY